MSSIWPIDKTLTGITNLGQCGTGSKSNEKVFYIHQITKNEASPSNAV